MDLTIAAIQLTSGLTIGALIGLALRKMGQMILTVLGFFLLGVIGLAYVGVITINWPGLINAINNLVGWLGISTSSIFEFLASSSVFGISLLVGAIMVNVFTPATFTIDEALKQKRRFVKKKKE
ncbi:MAG: FUN14 domain-containing protein [Thermoproteota archaeon]